MRLRRVLSALLVCLGVALTASAATFDVQQTDPLDDAEITPGYQGETAHGLDIGAVAIRYDASFGVLRVTYTGLIPVRRHEGTSYSGLVSTEARVGGTCGGPGSLTFSGTSGTDSVGAQRWGTATLENGSYTINGQATFPAENVVSFEFSNAALLSDLGLRCASYFSAHWTDYDNVRNYDQVSPFCIIAGCFDPPPPLLLELSPPALGKATYSPGETISAVGEL